MLHLNQRSPLYREARGVTGYGSMRHSDHERNRSSALHQEPGPYSLQRLVPCWVPPLAHLG
jgi:hypothetical protein